MRIAAILVAALSLCAQTSPERHAYYLYIDGPAGCEACYVPLLITAQPLESLKSDESAFLIVTYERDSIWEVKGPVAVSPHDVESQPRRIRFQGKQYRFQSVPAAEARRLLQHPEGTIPIHRLKSPSSWPSSGPTREEILAGLQ
jgi:hypothetical protein